MKKLFSILVMFISASIVLADPPQPLTLDFSPSYYAPEVEVYKQNAKTIRVTVNMTNVPVNLSGYTPFMYWAKTPQSASYVPAVCTAVSGTTGIFDAVFSSNALSTNGVFIYGAGISNNSGTTLIRQGKFTIIGDPSTGGNAVKFVTPLNASMYQWSGAITGLTSVTAGSFIGDGSQLTAVSAAINTNSILGGITAGANIGVTTPTNGIIIIDGQSGGSSTNGLASISYVDAGTNVIYAYIRVSTNALRIQTDSKTNALDLDISGRGYLTAESDPNWSAADAGYMLLDGSRQMSGDLGMAGHEIWNASFLLNGGNVRTYSVVSNNFTVRPTVNGTNVLLVGEVTGGAGGDVFTFGTNILTGTNTFRKSITVKGLTDTDPDDVSAGYWLNVDGPHESTRGVKWMENGTNKWDMEVWNGEDGEFLYLYNHELEESPLTIARTGRIGVNKPGNILNYHSSFNGSYTNLNDFSAIGTNSTRLPWQIVVTITSNGVPDGYRIDAGIVGSALTSFATTNPITAGSPFAITNGVFGQFDFATGHVIGNSFTFIVPAQLPTATMDLYPQYFDEVQVNSNATLGTTYKDLSYDAAYSEGTPFLVPTNAPAAWFIGRKIPFNSIYYAMMTNGLRGGLQHSYWNGSQWTALNVATNNYQDQSGSLTNSGVVRWDTSTMPTWTIANSTNGGYTNMYYWIKAAWLTTPTNSPMFRSITPNGRYRFATYQAWHDSTPAFHIDANGQTFAEKGLTVNGALLAGTTNVIAAISTTTNGLCSITLAGTTAVNVNTPSSNMAAPAVKGQYNWQVWTNTYTMTAVATTNNDGTGVWPQKYAGHIGRLFVGTDQTNLFDVTGNWSLWGETNRANLFADATFRFFNDTAVNSLAAGATNIYVMSGAGFASYDTIRLKSFWGTTNEYLYVSERNGTNLLLKRPVINNYNATNCAVGRVLAMGPVNYAELGAEGTNRFHSTLTFPTAVTVTIREELREASR